MKRWTEIYNSSELVLFEDDKFIFFNKPPCVPSQEDQTGDESLLSWGQKHFRQKLHLVNRIDRPVSGIVLCTRTREAVRLVSQVSTIEKSYIALVTPMTPAQDRLEHFIKKNGQTKKAYISEQSIAGYKPCSLEYKTRHILDNYAVIDITTKTGRYHQIRAQLAHIGYPIKGDIKYGARRSNKDRSVDLHAHHMAIPAMGLDVIASPIGRESIWQYMQAEKII